MRDEDVRGKLKSFILDEFLPGESPDTLTDTTELITSRVIDSLATLRLVAFAEETFGVVFEPYETDVQYLNTVRDIAALIVSKGG